MLSDEEIAIVGIGCRFPGADNLEEFWRVLVNGENHVFEIPKERWHNEAFYSEDINEAGKHYVKRAGFLKEHDEWDHKLFGVSESEAVRIDPQQRYVLECTHMAMEDGGITRADMKGSQTGVYIGVMNDDYKVCLHTDHNDDTNYSATGMSTAIIASRVSYTYDLQGPCMVIDTACSSSMTALHLGSQAIKNGDCDMAICGGVNSIISPGMFITLCRARMMSAVGQCQTFCDTADGYARGEGCGVVILKSVKKAIEEGNKIWGVLYTGINQDGHATSPITSPSGDQQMALLNKVYKKYKIDPLSLQYIEAHGTGTPVGDPIEINALGQFLKDIREKDIKIVQASKPVKDKSEKSIDLNKFCEISEGLPTNIKNESPFTTLVDSKPILIGSVKTNIGHTEAAASVASLIKVLLMMKHEKYVPSLHLNKDKSNLNKNIHLQKYNLDISLDSNDWEQNSKGERMGCINSFGFGGSNGHAIVIQKTLPVKQKEKENEKPHSPYNIVYLSAMDKNALVDTIRNFEKSLKGAEYSLRDVAYTSALKRDHYKFRTLVFGKTKEDILNNIDTKLKHVDEIKEPCKLNIVFVFCGVGTTWTGMGMEMMQTQPVFKAKIKEIDFFLKKHTGWSISEKLESNTDYSDPFINHVSIFCVQVALVALWHSFGVIPDMIVGQSVGEVAAAVASGALSLEDGITVIYHRSYILAQRTGGKMLVVGNISIDRIQELCAENENRASIAVYNSPTSCTLSGDKSSIEIIKAKLETLNKTEKAGILIKPLSVNLAYHSHHVQPCMIDISKQLSNISGSKQTVGIVSTVTGDCIGVNELQSGRYWSENIRNPVMFMQAVLKASKKDAVNVFLELGPKPVLMAHIQNIMGENLIGFSLPSLSHKRENLSFLTSLSILYEMGTVFSFESLDNSYHCCEPIPSYKFNKSKMLYFPEKELQYFTGNETFETGHMFVKTGRTQNSFKLKVSKKTTPFVYDHSLENIILVPGSTYIEAAFEMGQKYSNLNIYEFDISIEFVNSFSPPDDKEYILEANVFDEDNEVRGHKFQILKEGRSLCYGSIKENIAQHFTNIDLRLLKQSCTNYRNQIESYRCLEMLDLRYGPLLRLIQHSWTSANECFANITLPDVVKQQTKLTHLHPSIIDAVFQTFGVLNGDSESAKKTLQIPKSVGSVIIKCPPRRKMICYSQKTSSSPNGNSYNCLLLSENGAVLAEIQNLYTKLIYQSDPIKELSYALKWKEINFEHKSHETLRIDNDDIDINKHIIFGSSRFIESSKPFRDQANADFVEIDFSMKKSKDIFHNILRRTPNARSVTFAPCINVRQVEEENVYDKVMTNFLTLSYLISTLNEYNYNMPLIVVTESTIANEYVPSLEVNVCGGELWGMVRSIVAENAYSDIRIVDVSINEKNLRLFYLLTLSLELNLIEYQIQNGKLFTSELVLISDLGHQNQREIKATGIEQVTLKTSDPKEIVNPHFNFTKNVNVKTRLLNAHLVDINLHRVSIHDPTVYPLTADLTDCHEVIWSNNLKKSYSVISLEGLGSPVFDINVNCKNVQPKDLIGFCFPVNVASTVSVPNNCVFSLEDIPSYIPGMMTSCVILWNIVESCSNFENIHIIVDDNSNTQNPMIIYMFSRLRKSQIKYTTLANIDSLETYRNYTLDALVILTNLTQNIFERVCRFPFCNKIISTHEYCQQSQQRWIFHNMPELKYEFLEMDKMFAPKAIGRTFPNILQWLKSQDKSILSELKDYIENVENNSLCYSLKMCRNALSLNKTQVDYDKIPLMVDETTVFRKDSCYILVGGLTGLGWELLKFMAELGAGYLATFSRRAIDKDKLTQIDSVEREFECKIVPMQVDITELDSLLLAFTKLETTLDAIHIKGIFHGGGVISDITLDKMTVEQLDRSLKPKVLGTWNLHLASFKYELDFFVMHSSIVSILGNVGQCNYAAGNSFQDSFAHYRRSIGLCGQSINWSTLSVGMVKANKSIEKMLKNQGFHLLSISDIKICFMKAIIENPPQVTFGQLNWDKLVEIPTLGLFKHKFSKVFKGIAKPKNNTTPSRSKYYFDNQSFANHEPVTQRRMVKEYLKNVIADTIIVEKEHLSEEVRVVTIGIDSMAAMSLINIIYESVHIRLPIVTILSESTTIGSLTSIIYEHLSKDTFKQNIDESQKQWPILESNITFMQEDLLTDYFKNPLSLNFIRQADFELNGIRLDQRDWTIILNNLLNNHSELRRVFAINKESLSVDSRILSKFEAKIDVKMVDFESICNEYATDDREKNTFDLSTDVPIKFKLALKHNTARFRMYVHSVISDLSAIFIIFNDVKSYINAYVSQKNLPTNDLNCIPAECLRNALSPRMDDMKTFWKAQLSRDIQPFTFTNNLDFKLNTSKWSQVEIRLPQELVSSVLLYIRNNGTTLYNFIMSVYLAYFHGLSRKDYITVITNVDMRGHVPELESVVTRCINAIPVVWDFRTVSSVFEYLKASKTYLNHLTENSGFPYKLIEEEMLSDTLRKHIGRHRVVMDNVTNLNKVLKDKNSNVTLHNIYHKRHVYETSLYISYDLNEQFISLEFSYNSDAVKPEIATKVPLSLTTLMSKFITHGTSSVLDIVNEIIDIKHQVPMSDQTLNINHDAEKEQQVKQTHCDDGDQRRSNEIAKESSSMNSVTVLHKGLFRKQTRRGWDHEVNVAMAKYSDNCYSNGSTLFLQWAVPEMYCLMFKMPSRWFVLKTKSREQVITWFDTFEAETRPLQISKKDNSHRL